jgi:hypothetical protein
MDTVMLKVTSAIFIGGKMARQGDVVEVTKAEAKDLLHRGKARLAEVAVEDVPASDEHDARVGLVEAEAPRRRRGKRSE